MKRIRFVFIIMLVNILLFGLNIYADVRESSEDSNLSSKENDDLFNDKDDENDLLKKGKDDNGEIEQEDAEIKIEVTSPEFKEGEFIPKKFTCEGDNINPELNLKNLPEKTVSIVIICDDPDAPVGIWIHWIAYNLPGNLEKIPENMDLSKFEGAKHGVNSWGKNQYGGPCPPPGDPHRYYFKVYALDTLLEFEGDVTKERIEEAMEEHILSQGCLMGRYKR